MSEAVEKITVVLGNYKGIKIPKMEVSVTEEEIEGELKRAQRLAAVKEEKNGPAETGDQTIIDFMGYIDGTPFPGGDGKDCPLTLGSGTFIPGFEEQLLGSKKGDHVEVKVTFPKNYQVEDVAGKDAVFQVDVKEVLVLVLPEIGDEMAKAVSPCSTLEEFKEYVKGEIRKFKTQELSVQKENIIISQIMETSTVTVPEHEIKAVADNLKQDFIMQLQSAGQTIEGYLQQAQMTKEKFDQSAMDQAEMMLKGQGVLSEIAKQEGLTVSDKELQAELTAMAQNYQTEVDKLKETIGEKGVEMVKENLAGRKAMELLLSIAEEA